MGKPSAPRRLGGWIVDALVGGIGGAVIGSIIAVNVIIFMGTDRGYEASLVDVFRHSAVAGVLTVAILAGSPVIGVVAARRVRRSRVSRNTP